MRYKCHINEVSYSRSHSYVSKWQKQDQNSGILFLVLKSKRIKVQLFKSTQPISFHMTMIFSSIPNLSPSLSFKAQICRIYRNFRTFP